MGTKARYRPQRLAAKLLQIRRGLGFSQSQLASSVDVTVTTARICEYEKGKREPPLMMMLAYAYLVGIHVDDLIDDAIDLPAHIRIKPRRKRVTLPS